MKTLTIRTVAGIFLSALLFQSAIFLLPQDTLAQESIWPTNGWPVASEESQGIDSDIFAELDVGIREGQYGYVDRMLVVRNGHLIVNHSYVNDYREASRGVQSPLGCGFESCQDPSDVGPYNYFHPDFHPFYQGSEVHSLQSVTKSVAATAVGIALNRGEIDGLDSPLLSFFDQYDLSGVDERLHRATLEDLLTMRSGIEWHEQDRPLDETNTTLLLERSEDWIQFTLDQPMDAVPGTKWAYSSGGSHLMSGIVRNATGEFIDAYADKYLFKPLGIENYHWKKTPSGFPDTEGGLYLEAEQLAKIGYLYLRAGEWDGKQIVSKAWVSAATALSVENVNSADWGYGYQWWRLDQGDVTVWAGLGFGGQFLFVLPEYDMIGVVNSWNLFDRTEKIILTDFLGALIRSVQSELDGQN